MRSLSGTFVLAAALIASSCSSVAPIAVHATDTCYQCGKPILDVRMAGEAIDADHLEYPFGSPKCLAAYVVSHPREHDALFVTDYTTGHMIDPTRATFVPVVVDDYTNERDYRAYLTRADADAAARPLRATPVGWNALITEARQSE
jgi:hypothetical protein